jgi:hypothetical protein
LTPNSRSYLNRWVQPDAIIPDPYNPQDYDRYSYVRSNPVNYNDPSGHIACWDEHANDPGCSNVTPTAKGLIPTGNLNTAKLTAGGEIPIIIGVIGIIAAVLDDANREHRSDGRCPFGRTYAQCFNANENIKFSHDQPIDMNQFIGLLDAINADLNRTTRTRFDVARFDYDTPFYTGNANTLFGFGSSQFKDETVCFPDKCYLQSDVNYIGEGMYAAAAGLTIDEIKNDAASWKNLNGHSATEDTFYWVKLGYDYYIEKNKKP